MANGFQFDKNEVKDRARGYWGQIVNEVAGIDDDFLSGSHGPCPICGGGNTADRFRFTNYKQDGGSICNQCDKKCGDGFAMIEWILGISFSDALSRVAGFLGMTARGKVADRSPRSAKRSQRGSRELKKDKRKGNSKAKLNFIQWNELTAMYWCKKKGFSAEAIHRFGAKLARYGKANIKVIAFPLIGEDSKPIGYTIFRTDGQSFIETNRKTGKQQKLKYRTVKDA